MKEPNPLKLPTSVFLDPLLSSHHMKLTWILIDHSSLPATYNDIHIAVGDASRRIKADFGESFRHPFRLLLFS